MKPLKGFLKLDKDSLIIPEPIKIEKAYRTPPSRAVVLEAGEGSKCMEGDIVHFKPNMVYEIDGEFFVKEKVLFSKFRGDVTLPSMIMNDGYVMVEVPFLEKKVDFLSKLRATESRFMATIRRGIVRMVSDTAVNPDDAIISSYSNQDPTFDVEFGDTVFISPMVIHSIMSGTYIHQSYFQVGDKHFLVFPYRELTMRIRDGKMKGLNGWAFATKTTGKSKLILPAKVKEMIDHSSFKLAVDVDGLKAGTSVMFRRTKVIPTLEPEFNKTLFETYYIFKEKEILIHFDKHKNMKLYKQKVGLQPLEKNGSIQTAKGSEDMAGASVGKITHVGDECKSSIKEGTIVAYPTGLGEKVEVNGVKILIMSESDLIGELSSEEAKSYGQ